MSNRKKPKKRKPNKRQKETGPPMPPRQTPHDHGHEHSDNDVWIFTEPTIDGTGYMVTINAGKDKAATLTPDDALRYAQHLLWVCSRAEYDALVARQLYDVLKGKDGPEPPERTAVYMVQQLREDRPDLDDSVTYPLTFSAGVNPKWKPFITVEVEGLPKGQWDLPAARRHALGVLEAVHVADLDAGYKRLITGTIGLPEGTAESMIGHLAELRGDPFQM